MSSDSDSNKLSRSSLSGQLTSSSAASRPGRGKCVFFAGLFGTFSGIRSIRTELEAIYGTGNVAAINSIVSSDYQGPDRSGELRRFLDAFSEDAGSLDIILHSGGALEFAIICMRREGSFYSKAERANIFLVSPAGFIEDIGSAMDILARLIRLSIAMSSPGPFRGIDSFSILPFRSDSPFDDRALRRELGAALGIQGLQTETEIPSEPQCRAIPSILVEQASEIDAAILEAAARRDSRTIRALLRRRGEALSSRIGEAFAGDAAAAAGERPRTDPRRAARSLAALAGLASRRQPQRLLGLLSMAGAQIFSILPEYDIVVSPSMAHERLVRMNAKMVDGRQAVSMAWCTHAGFAVRPAALASSILFLSERLGGGASSMKR
jgi:hypothetical protein